ncbi:hypothetical protein GCM10028820_30230 [Tessaracoccus terricola]
MPDRPGSPRRSLGARIRRLFATAEELEAADQQERARESGAQQISEASPRSVVRLRGTVSSMTTQPDSGWLEAELSDGSGSVKLVWMGHRRLECVLPGTELLVAGRLARDEDGNVIYNPDFEVLL